MTDVHPVSYGRSYVLVPSGLRLVLDRPLCAHSTLALDQKVRADVAESTWLEWGGANRGLDQKR
jgi:hypothetical protein